MSAPTARRGPQGGPPPLAPALAYGALLIAAVAVWIGAPQAGASAVSTLSYAQSHTGQMHAEAVLVFGATLTLLTSALDFTLPIGRFGGLIFIVATSVLLPASRHRLTAAAPVAA